MDRNHTIKESSCYGIDKQLIPKAQGRYKYGNCLGLSSVVTFKVVRWPILIKFHVKLHQEGAFKSERVHKVCRLIGLELWLP